MLILGLDQSINHTGWCLYQFPGDERRMTCGTFSCSAGNDAEEQCDIFCRHLRRLIGKHRPGFIVWERASRRISAYPKKRGAAGFIPPESAGQYWTVNADQLLLPEIQGAVRAAAVLYQIPYESVPTSTWRADIFGSGYGNMSKAEAKPHAKEYCRRLGIQFNNEHEAEAACITRWAATCSQRFKMLRWRKELEEQAA